MEMIAISAARWAVGRALSPVSDGLLESWAASSKLGPNIRALKLQLLYAQGMLDNARGRDVGSPALGQLLQELRSQAYDADDVLDELEYFRVQDELDGTYETTDAEAQGLVEGLVLNARHTAGAVVSKLKLPSCSCVSVVCHHRRKPKLKFDRVAMSKRIVDIVEQLKPVCAMVSTILDLELQGTIASTGTTALPGTPFTQITRNTTPQIIERKLYGRDELKKDVIDRITYKYRDNDGLTVLSIVGPGGLGKTTLTQHIYEEAKSHFQVPVWVCVSQNFSASRLAQEIVKQIPKLDNENGNESNEDLIEKRLHSKRFFLVLDDMWTYHDDEWKKLLAPLKKGQTKGNMVIVTTRIPKVAQMVTTIDYPVRLERLNDEECMSLLKACVFGDQHPWEEHTNLLDVGWEILNKLKGFPLAVKTVGRLLKTELIVGHWRRVLESKEWEYQSSEDDIMPALKLSYNYLPFHLQQCFSHCALFPEDYEFGQEELIHLWIGLGLLGPNDQNKSIEDIGLDYLSDLVSHGFFQEGKKEDGHIYYVIHDLLHDLSRNVSASECLSIQGSNLWSMQIPTSIRHMSIIINNEDVDDKKAFENRKRGLATLGKRLKARNLRTLMLFGANHGSFCKIFSGMFWDAKSLRVIFLSGASYDVEVLLHSFSQLVHLRYLRIKGKVLNLRSLFGSISRFYNLLVLDIKECYTSPYMKDEEICSSTRDISNLVNIRHFVVGNNSYHCGIFEVGKFKSIQELRRFEVKREKYGFGLNQLGKLIQLRGSLEICNLEKVGGTTELEELKLVHLQHLNRLILRWGENLPDRDSEKEDVLELLMPHNNLQELCIRGHGGDTYPTWLCSDHSAKNLECLCLEGVAWKSLPPLLGGLLMVGEERPSVTGQIFQNMKRLELVNIRTLKQWSLDCPFSKLEVLTVKDCSELTELPFPHMFPILQQIYISDCVKLVSVPPIPWNSSLSKAKLWRVGKSILNLGYWKNEQIMIVEFKKDALDCELWNVLVFSNLSEVKEFEIRVCPTVPLHHLQLLNSLKILQIRDCSSILWPTEGENSSPFKFSVEQLKIFDWGGSGKELAQLISYFPNLSTLELWGCGNKQAGGAEDTGAAARGQLLLPLQLKELLQNQSSLRSVYIWDCPMLLSSSSLPSFYCPFPTSLQSLDLHRVKDGMLTLAPLTNLTKLVLSDCGGVRSEDLWHLLAQGRLKELRILGALNLLDVPEPSRFCGQDLPQHSSRLQALETDGEAGGAVAVVPIGVHFSSSLTELVLGQNDDLEHFTMEQSEALQMLTSLQVLQIQSYSRLQSLPEGLSGLSNLKKLWIWACGSIRSLPKGGLPSSLVELHIQYCEAIRSLPKGTLPSSLTELDVHLCIGFRSLPKGSLPSSLKILSIRYCPAFRSLHEGSLPRSLQTLDVTGSNDKLQRQCRKLQGTIPIIRFR